MYNVTLFDPRSHLPTGVIPYNSLRNETMLVDENTREMYKEDESKWHRNPECSLDVDTGE